MTEGKGAPRYATLPVRDLVPVQVAHLRTRFELAERSFLAEQAALLTNQALARWEAEQGIRRLRPGECLVEWGGRPVALPLISAPWSQRLAQGLSVAVVQRHLEIEQLQALQQAAPDATLEDV